MVSRIVIFKFALIATSLTLGGAMIGQRLVTIDAIAGQIAYIVLYGGLALGLFAAAMIRNGPVRWILAIMLGVSGMLIDGYQYVVGDHLTYEFFVTMVQSSRDVGDALDQQATAAIRAGLQALALIVGIGWPPRTRSRAPQSLLIGAAPVLVLALAAMLFVRGGDGSRGLPSPFVGAAFGLLDFYENATAHHGRREAVTLARDHPGRDGDIVLIVDESIAGRYLDINDTRGVRSGLARPPAGIAIANFGLAAAVTHCSVGANLTLRYGGTRANYHDVAATRPSIWSYAKAAGYGTVYIDAQRTGGAFNNGMDIKEARAIDRRIQFDNVPVRDRDMAVANRLATLLSDGQRQFIYINKIGAHFPVQDKYPDAFMRYRPVGARGRYGEISDTGDRSGLSGDAQSWRLYRNAYRNTLTWNVGNFFDTLFARAKTHEAVAIYMSDHGQTLHERGEPGQATHCTPQPVAEEGTVPLVVIDWADASRAHWADAARHNFNGSSAFRLFPTLLGLMGYNRDAVEALYGPDLAASSPDPMTFDIRYNARLGRGPSWQKISPGAIVRPPANDTTGDN